MNSLLQLNFDSRALKVYIVVAFCISCMGYAMGMHENGRVDVVNLLVNKENRSALPESLFDVTLMKSNLYSVVYKEKRTLVSEERVVIEEQLGKGNSPTVRYVDSDDCRVGVMPTDIRLLFDDIDAFCVTNGIDYFVASIDGKIVENGKYARALSFVVTNTPPSSKTQTIMHPVLGQLLSLEFHKSSVVNTNTIPVGANPSKWF